ncbi:DNA cytosine methyltransferase [Vibrio parahaemolyticus]|nr:DNA cytosine methyltransferase [Vibrio parahaemolyticus]
MNTLHCLDLFTGIGGFHLAAQRNGHIKTICTSEIDTYNVAFIDRNLGLDNAGDVSNVAVPLSMHPDTSYAEQDLVAVEETGFTTLSLEDFMEGVLPWPDIVCGGFPCQDISAANTLGNHAGINGERSGLVTEQLRIIEDLEPRYVVMENSDQLPKRGLANILAELNRLGYQVEWETVSAVHYGYPHYRHRTYLVAYLTDSAIAQQNKRVFDVVRRRANKKPDHRFPLLNRAGADIIEMATVENPRSIKLRTKRINSLGNAIIPDIALAIFDAITEAENKTKYPVPAQGSTSLHRDEQYHASLIQQHWQRIQTCLFDDNTDVDCIPSRGLMREGHIYTGPVDRKLNPTKTTYENMYSTLISRDGNNNFTTKSRLNRPGKLGGLIGDLMRLGANKGGLSPIFAERFMGYPDNYTALKE